MTKNKKKSSSKQNKPIPSAAPAPITPTKTEMSLPSPSKKNHEVDSLDQFQTPAKRKVQRSSMEPARERSTSAARKNKASLPDDMTEKPLSYKSREYYGKNGRNAEKPRNKSFGDANTSYNTPAHHKSNYKDQNSRNDHTPRPNSDYNQKHQSYNKRQRSHSRSRTRFEGDYEFDCFIEEQKKIRYDYQYKKVSEREQDLFLMPSDYSLGHCVAEDMGMGAGIAVQFRKDFKKVAELLEQRAKTGGLAVLEKDGRFIYYLVTKPKSQGKPTLQSLFASLKKLRNHIVENRVTKLALPRIGCGLDRLDWGQVKYMLEYMFRSIDIEIVICNWQGDESSTNISRTKSSKVTPEEYPIEQIEAETIIIYLTDEAGTESEVMRKLDAKFNFLRDFRTSPKHIGECVVFTKANKYLLTGCVVRKSAKDPISFIALQKCLNAINNNRLFAYVGFQAVYEADDSSINEKIINLLRHSLSRVSIHICWPPGVQWSQSLVYASPNLAAYRDNVAEVRREPEAEPEPEADSWWEKPEPNSEFDAFCASNLSVEKVKIVDKRPDGVVVVRFVTDVMEAPNGAPLSGCPHIGLVFDERKNIGQFVHIGNTYYALVAAGESIEKSAFTALQNIKNDVVAKKHKCLGIFDLDQTTAGFLKKPLTEMAEFIFGPVNNLNVLIFKDKDRLPNNEAVFRATYHIAQIRKKTLVLYFASVHDDFPELDVLDKKFKARERFENEKKALGVVIQHETPIPADHILFGCIVKERRDSVISFKAMYDCVLNILRSVPSEIASIGFQAFPDYEINRRVVALLRSLTNLKIVICCPEELGEYWPCSKK